MSVESDLAVLDHKINATETVLERLADSFDKMSEVSNALNRMLAVHQEKFEHVAATNSEMSKEIAILSTDQKQATSELYIRLETNKYEVMTMIEGIKKDIKSDDTEKLKQEETKHERINKRLVVLEQWRWKSIGVITVVMFVLVKAVEFFFK